MGIRRHRLAIVGALAFTISCTDPPREAEEPAVAAPRAEATPAPEPEPDRSAEIEARNREILDRLARAELERSRQRALEQDIEPDSEPTPEVIPASSGMAEMEARAAALEPRVAAIGEIADRVDENYRRYADACQEKFTTATTSYAATPYYEPYQPVTISNETTPYCRKLWSDLERDADAVELAMRSLTDEARRRGVLPGHLRALTRKYRLDRDGWR